MIVGFLKILIPLLVLALASLGTGMILMRAFFGGATNSRSTANYWLAYFLGQCVLASGFLLLALTGHLLFPVTLGIILTTSLLGCWLLYLDRRCILHGLVSAREQWHESSWLWRLVFLSLAVFYIAGFGGVSGLIAGDGIAFYLVLPKVVALTGQLHPLPGYETISQIGLLAEMLLAVLGQLGMPSTTVKLFPWFNALPQLGVLYLLTKRVAGGRKAGLIAVTLAMTSSAFFYLWTSGKVDLVAMGPALCGVYCSVCLFEVENEDRWLLFLTGLFVGFAAVMKLSYLVVLLPNIFLIVFWRSSIDIFQAVVRKRSREFWRLFLQCCYVGFLLGVGGGIAFIPHSIKNIVLFDSLLGVSGVGGWYAAKTVVRLLLTYPLALVYGEYWAQYGRLSPLFLAFLPLVFWLKRSVKFRDSKLCAFSVATGLSLTVWVVLFPSIFMPRYYLITLIAFAIPIAISAAAFIERKPVFNSVVCVVMIVSIAMSGFEAIKVGFIRPPGSIEAIYSDVEECENGDQSSRKYCKSHKAINAMAQAGDRVFLRFYRYWLTPDLLMDTYQEKDWKIRDALAQKDYGQFWEYMKDANFRFILYDEPMEALLQGKLLIECPDNVKLTRIETDGYPVYKIQYLED